MVVYGYEFYVDVVMCVDGTASMSPIIEEIKKRVLSFSSEFADVMEEIDKPVAQIRIKVIVFRDFSCDEEPMVESPFYLLPDQSEEFSKYVNSIEAKGGKEVKSGKNEASNALEAIALAIKSDWTTGGSRRRHIVMVFSDAPALPLGERTASASYPSDIPVDIARLGSWWEGNDQTLSSTYQAKAGRLVAFVPNAEPWNELQVWNRYWPAFCNEFSSETVRDFFNAIFKNW